MNRDAKLGRLVVSNNHRHPPRVASRAVAGMLALASCSVVVLVALAWYWLAIPPRKLVVRGSSMLPAPELAATLGIDGSDSAGEIWLACRSFDGEGTRWAKSASCRPLPGRALLIQVHEKKPLLRVLAGASKLWLCQDGYLLAMDPVADHGGAFDKIRQLPTVRLQSAEAGTRLPEAPAVLEAAAACYAALPGEIEFIELDAQGQLALYDLSGFPIKLGEPTMLGAKISALPKALRICSANRDKLLYLDASNPAVFYEKWKEPQVKAGT